jgi:YD repeat-containing protein
MSLHIRIFLHYFMKKYLRLYFLFVLSNFFLLAASAAMWDAGGMGLHSINLQGSLSKKYDLGQLGPIDSEVFPLQLVHSLSPYPLESHETFSKWEVPQLTTYVVPHGQNSMLWISPGGKEVLFDHGKNGATGIFDTLPAQLPRGWIMLKPKDSNRVEIHSDEGWVYVYQEGEVQTLEMPQGRKLYFETNLIEITSIALREGGKTSVLLEAFYDDLGRLSRLNIGPIWHAFQYEGDTELLKQWTPFGVPERAIRFNYQDGLISTITYPSNRKESYAWQEDVSNYSPGEGLRFDRFESPAILLSDSDYTYRIGENQEGINLVSTNKLEQEESLIYNPLTKRLITVGRGGLRREMQWNTDRSNPAGDKLVGVIAPDGDRLVTLEYDESARVSVIDNRGKAPVRLTYDNLDRVTERKRGDDPPSKYGYKGESEKAAKITNPLGDSIEYSFTADGQLERYRDLNGGLHQFFYDDYGRLARRIYPMDVWVAYSRDEFGRIVGIAHSNGSKTQKVYDQFNQLQEVIANGVRWSYQYDQQGRLVQVMRNAEVWRQMSYQSNGDKFEIAAVDDEGNRTEGVYNLEGELLEETNPIGETINYRYDPIGQLAGWTDQEEGIIEFDFDDSGKITSQTNALNQQSKKHYDDLGRLNLRDSGEQKVNVEYDDAERVTKIDYGNEQVITYQYDGYGRIQETTSGKVRTTFAYTALDQLTGKRTTYPDGAKYDLIFTYTPSGNRQTMRFRRLASDGEVLEDNETNYTYDSLGRIKSIEKNYQPVATYRYDPKSLLLAEKVLGNGNRLIYDYNPLQQLELVSTYDKEGNLLQSLDYGWNMRGQLVSKEMLPVESGQNEAL